MYCLGKSRDSARRVSQDCLARLAASVYLKNTSNGDLRTRTSLWCICRTGQLESSLPQLGHPIMKLQGDVCGKGDDLIIGVVVPNVTLRGARTFSSITFIFTDTAMFRRARSGAIEDDPLEYARVDLSFAVSSLSIGVLTAGGTSRRRGTADVLHALVSSVLEAETTEVVLTLTRNELKEYIRKKEDEDS